METLENSQKEMLEIKNTETEAQRKDEERQEEEEVPEELKRFTTQETAWDFLYLRWHC